MNCTRDIPDDTNGNCAIPREEHGGAEGPIVPETQFIIEQSNLFIYF